MLYYQKFIHKGSAMSKLFIKASEVEEKDSFKIFNERGKAVYYTKDDFIATGHRIKIFLEGTISEAAYVQEKQGRFGSTFEFSARDKFGTIARDHNSRIPRYLIDFDENWLVDGDVVMWNYIVHRGSLITMKVTNQKYLIPGQALNLTDTYILDFPSESDMLIGLSFAMALWAVNKYDF